MNTYFLRCRSSDLPTLLTLLLELGALIERPASDDVPSALEAAQGGHWEPIGPIERPTGEVGEEGTELTAPMRDADGEAWWHANLTTPMDLGASEELRRFYSADENGHPKAPARPHRVLAGWTHQTVVFR